MLYNCRDVSPIFPVPAGLSLPVSVSVCSSVLSSLLLWYLFYLHFFMAFCRASGHVLVITICHWFPVNAGESRDGSISLSLSFSPVWLETLHSPLCWASLLYPSSPWAALLSHYASLCCCPAVVAFSLLSPFLFSFSSSSLSLSSASSLRRQAPLGHDILWPVACLVYLRYLAKRGKQQLAQLPAP